MADPLRGEDGPPRGDGPVIWVVGDVMVDVVVALRGAFSYASDTASRISTAPGGAAANQACWIARAGADARMIASVGADPLGDAAVRTLADVGVDITGIVRTAGLSTGVVVALVGPDGQRSMLTDRGANLALSSSDVAAALRALDSTAHVHLSAYALYDEGSRPAALLALAHARRSGATVSLDACSVAPLRAFGAARLVELVGEVDVLFANLDEGRALAEVADTDPDAVAVALTASAREVVLTLGALGVTVASRDGGTVRRAAGGATVRDTTGAGDAVCGTYLARRLSGADVAASLDAAVSAADRAVATHGARGWVAQDYSRE